MAALNMAPPEAKPKAKAPAKVSRLEGFLLDFIAGLAIVAVIVFVAGVGLNKGFGIHVPMLGGMAVLMAGLITVKTAASQVANTWHSARVKSDAALWFAQMEMQNAAQSDISAQLASFLKPKSESSPYL